VDIALGGILATLSRWLVGLAICRSTVMASMVKLSVQSGGMNGAVHRAMVSLKIMVKDNHNAMETGSGTIWYRVVVAKPGAAVPL
jgi:nicotinate-nucleotide pyrophosphorylase